MDKYEIFVPEYNMQVLDNASIPHPQHTHTRTRTHAHKIQSEWVVDI